jgi:hypothetical protein
MAESAAHLHNVDPGSDQRRGVAVAKAVKAHRARPGDSSVENLALGVVTLRSNDGAMRFRLLKAIQSGL